MRDDACVSHEAGLDGRGAVPMCVCRRAQLLRALPADYECFHVSTVSGRAAVLSTWIKNSAAPFACLPKPGHCGVPETLLIEVNRFTEATLAALVRAGFVSVAPHTVKAGGTRMTVVRLKITDAGRKVMAS
jgi:hypothetical protein